MGSPTPTQVMGLPKVPATAVTAGGYHACALLSDGTAWCWGDGANGTIGSGTIPADGLFLTAQKVQGLTGATAICAGGEHVCALSGGAGWCWGYDIFGELGNGEFITDGYMGSDLPVPVEGPTGGLLSGATALTCGAEHACAVASGVLYCWGLDDSGQLGNGISGSGAGSGTAYATPQKVSLTDPPAIGTIAAGFGHSCLMFTNASVYCWGDNTYGQLGQQLGPSGISMDATPAVVPSVSATALAAGGNRTCVVRSNGSVSCWGTPPLGNGTNTVSSSAVSVTGLPSAATAVSTGESGTCVILNDKSVWCWGYNNYGDVGDGTFIERLTPVQVSGW